MSDTGWLAVASDYAVIQTRVGVGIDLYYGYEITTGDAASDDEDEQGEWCFQAKRGREVVYTAAFSHLKQYGARDMFEVSENLLAGIRAMLEENRLTFPEQPVSA